MKLRLGKKFLPFFINHVFEFWVYYLGAMLCLIGLNYFQSEIPRISKEMGELAMDKRLSEVSLKYLCFLAFAILSLRTLSRLLFFYPARMQQKFLRNEFIWRMSQTPPEDYKDWNSGQLYQTIYDDLNRLRGFMGFALLQVGNIIVALFIFIPKISAVDSKLLLAYIPFLVGMIIFSAMVAFFARYDRKGTDLQGEVQNFIVESYKGKRTIKNFNVEDSFIKRFELLSWSELQAFFKASFGRVLSVPLIRLSLGASFLWGAYIVYAENLGASTLIFFSGFLFLVFEPFMFLAWIGVIATGAWASWKRMSSLLEKTKDVEIDLFEMRKEKVLLDISLWGKSEKHTFEKGCKYLLCGDTGSGKSYFLLEMARKLRKEKFIYSMVFQEPYLYNDTLEHNLFLGQEIKEDDEKKAIELLKLFSLDDIISQTMGLKIELGENGKRISGGQAKRISLIRSIISGANVLIWDDPFSSVDVIHEKLIMEKLKEQGFFKDKILIFTAHRYSSTQYADYIKFIKDKEGNLIEGEQKEILVPSSDVYEYFKKQFI